MTQIIGDPKIEVKESLCGKNDENSNKCVVRFPDTLYNNLNNKNIDELKKLAEHYNISIDNDIKEENKNIIVNDVLNKVHTNWDPCGRITNKADCESNNIFSQEDIDIKQNENGEYKQVQRWDNNGMFKIHNKCEWKDYINTPNSRCVKKEIIGKMYPYTEDKCQKNGIKTCHPKDDFYYNDGNQTIKEYCETNSELLNECSAEKYNEWTNHGGCNIFDIGVKNYNPFSTTNKDCIYPGCRDKNAKNYDSKYTHDPETESQKCIYNVCNKKGALNYDPDCNENGCNNTSKHADPSICKYSLYELTTHTFLPCKHDNNQNGPTLEKCIEVYNNEWTKNIKYFNVKTNGYQIWTVPKNGKYKIEVFGAKGGSNPINKQLQGGNGSKSEGVYSLKMNDKYIIAVGIEGSSPKVFPNKTLLSPICGCGGGGASWVVKGEDISNVEFEDIIIVAGGGGGASGGKYDNAGSFKAVTTDNNICKRKGITSDLNITNNTIMTGLPGKKGSSDVTNSEENLLGGSHGLEGGGGGGGFSSKQSQSMCYSKQNLPIQPSGGNGDGCGSGTKLNLLGITGGKSFKNGLTGGLGGFSKGKYCIKNNKGLFKNTIEFNNLNMNEDRIKVQTAYSNYINALRAYNRFFRNKLTKYNYIFQPNNVSVQNGGKLGITKGNVVPNGSHFFGIMGINRNSRRVSYWKTGRQWYNWWIARLRNRKGAWGYNQWQKRKRARKKTMADCPNYYHRGNNDSKGRGERRLMATGSWRDQRLFRHPWWKQNRRKWVRRRFLGCALSTSDIFQIFERSQVNYRIFINLNNRRAQATREYNKVKKEIKDKYNNYKAIYPENDTRSICYNDNFPRRESGGCEGNGGFGGGGGGANYEGGGGGGIQGGNSSIGRCKQAEGGKSYQNKIGENISSIEGGNEEENGKVIITYIEGSCQGESCLPTETTDADAGTDANADAGSDADADADADADTVVDTGGDVGGDTFMNYRNDNEGDINIFFIVIIGISMLLLLCFNCNKK